MRSVLDWRSETYPSELIYGNVPKVVWVLFAGSKEQMYIELVQGLGETIVGNWPGCALSYTAEKAQLPSLSANSHAPESFPEGLISIKGFCSKSHALRLAEGGSVIIFRSDSNGEDLEG